MKMRKFGDRLTGLIPSLISVVIGIVLGWLILYLTNPKDAFAGIGTVLAGGFNEGAAGIGSVLYTATPIILTGLSVGFGMKTGLFNIGASGQFTVGAFTAIAVGVKCTFLPAGLHVAAAILCGFLAGALWGVIAGLLKAYCKVSEVISGIMLNYTAMLIVNLLIKSFLYDEKYNRSLPVASSALISKNAFDFLLPGSNISLIFFGALIVAVVIKILLDKTAFGYELKTTGRNPFAVEAAGVDTKRSCVLTLAIAGAVAGLGGALMFLCDFGDHIPVSDTILQQGFTGISVALLGLSSPFGIVLAGLFIAYITVGGNYLQLFSYTPDVVDMIIAVIIFCGALVVPIRLLIKKITDKRRHNEGEGWV